LCKLAEEFRVLGEDSLGGAAGIFVLRITYSVHANKLSHLPLFNGRKLLDLLDNFDGGNPVIIINFSGAGKAE